MHYFVPTTLLILFASELCAVLAALPYCPHALDIGSVALCFFAFFPQESYFEVFPLLAAVLCGLYAGLSGLKLSLK